jgi:hypothetical protein
MLAELTAMLQAAETGRCDHLSPDAPLRTVRSSPPQIKKVKSTSSLTSSMRSPAVQESVHSAAQRRWRLLRLYLTSVKPADRSLQRVSWDAALTAIGSTLPRSLSRSDMHQDTLSTAASTPRTALSRSTTNPSHGDLASQVDDGIAPWEQEQRAIISRVH